VFFVSNEGAGFANAIEANAGTTIRQFFDQNFPGRQPSEYLIRVNRVTVSGAQLNNVLNANDKFSATPTKIAGA
jgi:hypothetical protein